MADIVEGTLCASCSNCQILSEVDGRGPGEAHWRSKRNAEPQPWSEELFDFNPDCNVSLKFYLKYLQHFNLIGGGGCKAFGSPSHQYDIDFPLSLTCNSDHYAGVSLWTMLQLLCICIFPFPV